jgi:hypothetical protein
MQPSVALSPQRALTVSEEPPRWPHDGTASKVWMTGTPHCINHILKNQLDHRGHLAVGRNAIAAFREAAAADATNIDDGLTIVH